MFINDHMTPNPVTIYVDQTVAEANALLQQYNIRHLLVVNEDRVLQGILSDRDLRSARPSTVARSSMRGTVEEQVNSTPVSVLMIRDILFLRPYDTLDDALMRLQMRKIGALPVVDDEKKVVGIFTVADLINAYRELYSLGAKGSVLVSIEDNGDPQALSKLVHIMEQKRVLFTQLIRTPGNSKRQAMIYLRINTYNVRAIHKAVEAAGFVVHVPEASN